MLRTSEGWKKLLEIGAKAGCVVEGYDGQLGRIGQFAWYVSVVCNYWHFCQN
jgi:hypothetical protein